MRNLFILLSLFFCQFIFGQNASLTKSEPNCGYQSSPEDIAFAASLKEEIQRTGFTMSETVTSFPIKAHIIRLDNGTGGMTAAQLNTALGIVNTRFAIANMDFFLCGSINYINETDYYSFNTSDETALRNAHNVDSVINIYFANTVVSGTSGLCGYAYLPGGPDFIMMNRSCATNGSTLSHEIGHYFGLLHTHGPSNSVVTTELVDGSNCDTDGDYICDTPADPQLGNSTVNSSCIYTGTATDANGTAYIPDPENLMSYSRKNCRNHFSTQQGNVMGFVSQTSRGYLKCPTFYVDFTASETVSVCNTSLTVDFTYTGGSATSYEWDVDNNGVVDYTSANPSHTYTSPGDYTVSLKINNLSEFIFKTKDEYIQIKAPEEIPFSDNLDGGFENLALENPDNSTSWNTGTFSSCNSGGIIGINNYSYNAPLQEDYLLLPVDLTNAFLTELTFDVAYAPYSATYSDELKVEISMDCGLTYTEEYSKSGLTLGTMGGYQTSSFTPGGCSDWRAETIDLSDYDGEEILLRFTNVNGYGNNLFLDNIDLSGNVLLDLNLNYFEAAHIPMRGNNLSWSTASSSFEKFEILHSDDGISFTSIGSVLRQADQTNYEYLDPTLKAGIHYYQIQVIEEDGTLEKGSIKSVEITSKNNFTIAPNPARDQVMIYTDSAWPNETLLKIYDLGGKQLTQQSIQPNDFITELRVQELTTGIYILEFSNEAWVKTEKLIIK